MYGYSRYTSQTCSGSLVVELLEYGFGAQGLRGEIKLQSLYLVVRFM